MRCPSCNAECPDEARRCPGCGAKLARRRRDGDPPPAARNPIGLAAYRCGIWGLIPFLGLVLGPVALVLGLVAWHQERGNPAGPGLGPAVAAIILGAVTLLTNWAGLFLMVIGLKAGS